MAFDDLTPAQAKIIVTLIEDLADSDYEPEFWSSPYGKGWRVDLHKDSARVIHIVIEDVRETDLITLRDENYITLIASSQGYYRGYRGGLKAKSYEQYRLYKQPASSPGAVNTFQTSINLPATPYVDPTRIRELSAINNPDFDLSKLIRICEELNRCYENESFLAVAMLARAMLDHVPPIFGCKSFAEVVNNYSGGTKSFKQSMSNLENSSRKIADAHLHTKIRSRETLPNKTQVNFTNDLDVLLAEIIRALK